MDTHRRHLVSLIVRHGRRLSHPIPGVGSTWLLAIALGLVLILPSQIMLASSAPTPSGSVSLSAAQSSGQMVGTTITWTAVASGIAHPVYRFSVVAPNGQSRIVRDFSPSATFAWTPLHEGAYRIQVTAKAGYTAPTHSLAAASFAILPRAQAQKRVVSATANPMVALYSAPACSAGTDTVMFRPATGGTWQAMAPQICQAGQTINVYVAGMRANTRYLLRDTVQNGAASTTSPSIALTTGAPSRKLTIVTFGVKTAPTAQTDTSTPILFHDLIPNPNPAIANPVGTDMSGHLVWYYNTLRSGLTMIWPLRLLGGGTFILVGRDAQRKAGDNVLREVDLAGHTVRETNIDALNAQLQSKGQEIVYSLHHDALSLPNGDLAVIGAAQRTINGHDMMGDMIIVLDANWQVVWTWDAFHYLPTSRHAAPGEICKLTYPMTLCALPDPNSEDWMHSNAIGWSPTDQNLTLSIRHQNWVIKIDYRNGKGTGRILWTLGQGGTLAINSSTPPDDWFSHQHDAHFIDNTHLALFDNGNTRCKNGVVKGCHSRAQVWTINTAARTATLMLNVDLGNYSLALGSSMLLPNGNFYFGLGLPIGRSMEVTPSGQIIYELDSGVGEYRVYRVANLDINPILN